MRSRSSPSTRAGRAILLAVTAWLGVTAPGRADDTGPATERRGARELLRHELSDLAASLEHALETNDVLAAERLYLLEARSIRLVERAARDRVDGTFGGAPEVADARSLVARVLQLQERVQQHAITKLERVLPGEPARQRWARETRDLYRPLFRRATPNPNAPAETREQARLAMLQQFHDRGGSRADLRTLGPRSLARLRSGELAEWVQLGEREVRITTSGAKHPIIANFRSVRGAGSLKIHRSEAGEIVLAVVSNSSGNYKPGPGSTEGVVRRLVDLGVPEAAILVTSVIPSEPELVKLLLKASGISDPAVIGRRLGALREAARHAYRPPARRAASTGYRGLSTRPGGTHAPARRATRSSRGATLRPPAASPADRRSP